MVDYNFFGADISYAQGNANPANFQGSFCIINASRANVGLTVGSQYHNQVNNFRMAGREVGHYFFNGNLDPTTCANYFVDNLYDFRKGKDVLVLDVESEPSSGTIAWNPAQTLAFATQVYNRTGVKIGVYLNQSEMNGADWSRVVAFGCWLWLAYYNASLPAIRYWPYATMWQYTSSGYDHNKAISTLAVIAGSVPAPKKEEEDMGAAYRIADTATPGGIFWQEKPNTPLVALDIVQWSAFAANGLTYYNTTAASINGLAAAYGLVVSGKPYPSNNVAFTDAQIAALAAGLVKIVPSVDEIVNGVSTVVPQTFKAA